MRKRSGKGALNWNLIIRSTYIHSTQFSEIKRMSAADAGANEFYLTNWAMAAAAAWNETN